jgi:Na+-driven multidrug efflux pump
VDAVWWSFPLSSALSAILAVLYYKFGAWRSVHLASPRLPLEFTPLPN